MKASNDIEVLLTLNPDCVVDDPMFADADDLTVIARRMTNPRRVATARRTPRLGLSGPVDLEMEFD